MEPIRSAIERYFAGRGYAVDGATTRQAAKHLVLANRYDILMTDLRLGAFESETDGLEVARFARHMSPTVRIIVLTAYGSSAVEEYALRSGVDRFLAKPYPLRELWQLVEELLQEAPSVER